MSSLLPGEPKKSFTILAHASAWIVYGSFLHIANYLGNPSIKIINTIFYVVPLCLTFYVSVYCLNLYKRKGPLWSIASFFIVFLVMAAVGYCYIYLLLQMAGVKLYSSATFRDFVKYALLGYVQHFSYALLYFYVIQSFKKERELRRLQEEQLRHELENARLRQQELKAEQDKLQLEYAFLRSQVNPHFLHNTLNALYQQALDCSTELADNISKLARMMRYSLENVEFESGKVPLQKELDNLQLLIDIHHIRFIDSRIIDYTIEGEVDYHMIPQLSILTVVENAFKYGDLKDPAHPLQIRVKLQPDEIYFFCRNKKGKNPPVPGSTNIGLTNLSKRLDVAFKDKYRMNARNEDDFYTVELTIKN